MQAIREVINEYREYYIQKLEEDFTAEIKTNWNNIFNNVVTEFECYVDDEASALYCNDGNTVKESYDNGYFDEADIRTIFDSFVMFIDIEQYDF